VIKRKSAILTAIIVLAAVAWAAIVSFVIAPHFWVGAILSFGGGVIIGIGIAILAVIWFRGVRGGTREG